ncbi:hypothetical protein GSI_15574 [Ganoderma sinense ZZ0214-1]|uniref:Uncharacterized protein n=1 Tax=Ganoderma sinense ZZ0214-1 TaxID=1077348 RepID=A0A2G8RNI5_9APHY|nr:hypothetical protein GSI_15574 [Ganoderma sinense ZZ0214-1]
MPFRATLPVEIEENVIDQLEGDFASLRNCALTCRAWVPRSRTLLLRAVRIATRSSWNDVEDYFEANPDMRPLVQSLATAPIATERTRLLGTYPASLFKTLPNLRRWEIRGPVDAKDDASPKIFFHRATLTQLRLSPISELHVSTLQFPSQADFVQLLSSIPHLRVLECTEIQITKAKGTSSTARLPPLRRPLRLSTLQICQGKRADEKIVPCLLELTASSLQNLVVRRAEGSRRSNETDSLSAGQQSPLASMAATTATMSELRSLTLHVEQGPKDSVSTLILETFEEAASCVRALRRGSALESLEIHIHMSDALKNPGNGTSSSDPVSLALVLSENRIQTHCEALEASLLADWSTHLTVRVHIPSSWAPREVILRTLRESSFPKLEKKGLLDVGYSGGMFELLVKFACGLAYRNDSSSSGNACKPYAVHNGPVSALAVSPDGSWIASRSRNLVIIWDARTRMRAHEWVLPMDQPPSAESFAFSPDSKHLACSIYDRGRSSVEIRHVDDGHSVGVLGGCEIDNHGDGTLSQLICAWFPDRLLSVSLALSTVLVQSWDARTFERPSVQRYVAPFDHGSLVLSPSGRHLVGLAAAAGSIRCPVTNKRPVNPPRPRVGYRQRSRTAHRPPSHSARRTWPALSSHPLCVLWNLDAGDPGEVLLNGSDRQRVLAASFDCESDRLALSLADHTIRVWDTKTREQVLSMAEPFEERGLMAPAEPHRHLYFPMPSAVLSKAITFAPDGRHLLSLRKMRICDGRAETLLTAWDTLSGQMVLGDVRYENYDDTASSAVGARGCGLARFGPGCTPVASTSSDARRIHVMDLSRGFPLKTRTFGGPEGPRRQCGLPPDDLDVTAFVFSPDGHTLCWATKGGEVEIRSF